MSLPKFIVSLTTYGRRMTTVSETIKSLLTQTLMPNKIILWLDESEFDVSDIPTDLQKLLNSVFVIRFCPNFRSYKKLVPTMMEFPDSLIITVDDDCHYPKSLFSDLLTHHIKAPTHIISGRGRVINIGDKTINPYASWKFIKSQSTFYAPKCILPLGYSAVLYPPNSLYKDALNIELFSRIAPYADDLWFKAMSLLNGTENSVLPLSATSSLKLLDGTQESALFVTHNADDGNTEQMRAIVAHYPALMELFATEEFYNCTCHAMEFAQLEQDSVIGKAARDSVNQLRDAALTIEAENPVLALSLMRLAKKIRPTGPLINSKISEYQKVIAKNKK